MTVFLFALKKGVLEFPTIKKNMFDACRGDDQYSDTFSL